MSTLLKNNLPSSHVKKDKDAEGLVICAQDILILLTPFLSCSDSSTLLDFSLAADILAGKDGGVQKRGYKILFKLVENKKVTTDAEVIIGRLDGFLPNLSATAKKVCD